VLKTSFATSIVHAVHTAKSPARQPQRSRSTARGESRGASVAATLYEAITALARRTYHGPPMGRGAVTTKACTTPSATPAQRTYATSATVAARSAGGSRSQSEAGRRCALVRELARIALIVGGRRRAHRFAGTIAPLHGSGSPTPTTSSSYRLPRAMA